MRKIIAVSIVLFVLTVPAFSAMPEWASNPYSGYDSTRYVAATGTGASQDEADNDAIISIASFFGVSVDSFISTVSEVTMVNDDVSSMDSFHSSADIRTNTGDIVGITIVDHWNTGNLWFSLAVLDREIAVPHYLSNSLRLSRYVNSQYQWISNNIGSLDAYSAAIGLEEDAAALDNMLKILSVLSPSSVAGIQAIQGDEVRALASECKRSITISIKIDNDIYGALEKALRSFAEGIGLGAGRSGNARYVLEGDVELYPSPAPNMLVYVDYDINITMRDTQTGNTIITFRDSGREGHRSAEGASRIIAMRIDEIVEGNFKEVFRSNFPEL